MSRIVDEIMRGEFIPKLECEMYSEELDRMCRDIEGRNGAVRAIYCGDDQYPQPGMIGYAWPAPGFCDEDSAAEGAYLFQPDGDARVYYCDPDRDLVMEVN